MELMPQLFEQRHLRNTDKELTGDWSVMPESWKKFNESGVPFLFIRKPGEEFLGDSKAVLFIEKDGYNCVKDFFCTVFEDCHVEMLTRDEAEKYWEKVENGELIIESGK